MSFLAPAIFHTKQIIVSYTERNVLPIHITTTHYLPQSQTIPDKSLDNPMTKYHDWLKECEPDSFISHRNNKVAKDIKYREKTGNPIPYKDLLARVTKKINKVNNAWNNEISNIDDDHLSEIGSDCNCSKCNHLLKKVETKITAQSLSYIDNKRNNRSINDLSNEEYNFLDEKSDNDFLDEESGDDPVDKKSGDNNNYDIISIDKAFRNLALLGWRDKDEAIMNRKCLNKLSRYYSITELVKVMNKLAADLESAISTVTGALDSMEDIERKNFLYHVIAKGETMYYHSLEDPDFCLYMLDQYQPLYTFLQEKIR